MTALTNLGRHGAHNLKGHAMHCATCKTPIFATYEPLGLYVHLAAPDAPHRATPAPTEGRRVTRACGALITVGVAVAAAGRWVRGRA